MSNPKDNREMLMSLLRGASHQPRIYDLAPYGGFHLLVTNRDLSEDQLREEGKRDSDKHRKDLIEIVDRFPSMFEEMNLSPVEFGWVRDLLPEDIRVKCERRVCQA